MQIHVGAVWQGLTKQLEQLDALMMQTLAQENAVLTRLNDYLISHPGKRLRPALIFYTARCLGTAGPQVVQAAAAYELIHLASLVHDDIIDDSPWRRGAPSVYQRWGAKTAVLYGDFLFAQALSLAGQCGGPFVRRLGQAIGHLVTAEFEQQANLPGSLDDEAAYLQRIEKKTASVLSGCCAATAEMCGAAPQYVAAFTAYGRAVGMAYQISDDIMDFSSSAQEMGKMPLSDLAHGLATLPVIHALRTSAHRDALRSMLSPVCPPSRHECAQAARWLAESGSLAYAAGQAEQYAAQAVQYLQDLPATQARDALTQLAWYCAARVR